MAVEIYIPFTNFKLYIMNCTILRELKSKMREQEKKRNTEIWQAAPFLCTATENSQICELFVTNEEGKSKPATAFQKLES